VRLFFFILLFSGISNATLSPRMHSIMAQIGGSIIQNTNTNDTERYSNALSLEMLYLVRGGPTFGGRYLIENKNITESESGESYGPMAGYYWENGAFMTVTYDILAKLGRWRNGEGFELNLGYVEHIGSRYHIGLRLTHHDITYKTDITDNTAEKKRVLSRYPSLVFMYMF
jgi:hypothetical protein